MPVRTRKARTPARNAGRKPPTARSEPVALEEEPGCLSIAMETVRAIGRDTFKEASFARLCRTTVLVAILVAYANFCGWQGMWKTSDGRSKIVLLWTKNRNALIQVPPHERGMWWNLRSTVNAVFYDGPAYEFAYYNDAGNMFHHLAAMNEQRPSGFQQSFAVFSHENVSSALRASDQPKGPADHSSSRHCLGRDNLLFLSTGTVHSKLRQILHETIPALANPGAPLKLEFDDDELEQQMTSTTVAALPSDEVDAHVRATLIKTLFKSMFGASISPEGLSAALEYSEYSKVCVMREHAFDVLDMFARNKVVSIRDLLFQVVKDTPNGKLIKERAAAAASEGTLPSTTTEETNGDAFVRQVADLFAFAGIRWTTHLTLHSLDRIRSDPEMYMPLFEKSPTNFVHEEARVDPPAVSVTSVIQENTTMSVGREQRQESRSFDVQKGAPYHSVLSTANVDLDVFGGMFHSHEFASNFYPHRPNMGEILSWNGRLEDVIAQTAPRGCPAYKLSMELTQSLLARFSPSKRGVPQQIDKTAYGAKAQLRDAAVVNIRSINTHESWNVSILDSCGYVVWICAVLLNMGWVRGKGLGGYSIRFLHYLFAAVVLSAGYLWSSEFLVVLGRLSEATALAILYISCKYQDNRTKGIFYSVVVWALYIYLALLTWYYKYVNGDVGVTSMSKVSHLCFFLAVLFCVTIIKKHYDADTTDEKFPRYKSSKILVALSVIFGLCLVRLPVVGIFCSRLVASFLSLPLMRNYILEMDGSKPNTEVALPNKKCMKFWLRFWGVLISLITSGILIVSMTLARGDICVFEDAYPSPNDPDYHLCQGSQLSKVDLYGRFVFYLSRNSIQDYVDNREQYEDPHSILIPKYDAEIAKGGVLKGVPFMVGVEDEDAREESALKRDIVDYVLGTFMRSNLIFPIHDDPTPWKNLEEGAKAMKIAGSKHLPEPVTEWDGVDVTSDDTIAHMCFAGLAGSRVEMVEPGSEPAKTNKTIYFKADFGFMGGLGTREGYEQFGAIAYFGESLDLVKIYWSHAGMDVYPDSPHWNHVKWVFRCSALVGITAVEHLLENHMIYSNIGSTTSRETLPKNHPMRRLMKPFNHRTPTVNRGALHLLMPEYSLLHRTVSLTFDGVKNAFLYALKTVRYQPNPMGRFRPILKSLGDRFPFAKDGSDFYDIVHDFAASYIGIYYKDDIDLRKDHHLKIFWGDLKEYFKSSSNLPAFDQITTAEFIDVFACYVFHVTGFHHVVGNVAEYLMQPNFAAARIRPMVEVSDVEASMYGLLIAIFTGSKAPLLMNNFEHLLLKDEHLEATTAVFRDFQQNLTDFSIEIDRRNVARKEEGRWTYNGFDPRRMLSSVAI